MDAEACERFLRNAANGAVLSADRADLRACADEIARLRQRIEAINRMEESKSVDSWASGWNAAVEEAKYCANYVAQS